MKKKNLCHIRVLSCSTLRRIIYMNTHRNITELDTGAVSKTISTVWGD